MANTCLELLKWAEKVCGEGELSQFLQKVLLHYYNTYSAYDRRVYLSLCALKMHRLISIEQESELGVEEYHDLFEQSLIGGQFGLPIC